MTYKESLAAANALLAANPETVFIGYGLLTGRAAGTIPAGADILETTVAENNMLGVATGMSLRGRRPVVYFERADFLWQAADALVNHLDVLATLSRGQFKPAVIMRVAVGKRTKPLFTGLTHTRDCSEAFESALRLPVRRLKSADFIAAEYAVARDRQLAGESTLLFEYLDLF